MRDWMFSSVVSGLVPGKQRLQRAACTRKEAADADHLKANAEIGGQLAAVVDGAREE
jgi:hypothetical protein